MKQKLIFGFISDPVEREKMQEAWDDLWKSADKLIKNMKKKQKKQKRVQNNN